MIINIIIYRDRICVRQETSYLSPKNNQHSLSIFCVSFCPPSQCCQIAELFNILCCITQRILHIFLILYFSLADREYLGETYEVSLLHLLATFYFWWVANFYWRFYFHFSGPEFKDRWWNVHLDLTEKVLLNVISL